MTVLAEERRSSPDEEFAAAARALRPGEVLSWDYPITIEEFCRLVADADRNLELENGVIYMSPPPSDAHEDLNGWLLTVLRLYVDARRLGKVRGSRSGVRVGNTSLPEPDLLFFRTEHLDRMGASGVHDAPDFIIEIVDSDTSRHNAVRKQAQYQEVGVAELWVVDLPRGELRHFLLDAGRYRRVEVSAEGEIAARTVDGFRLKTEWLFQGPDFPSSLEVVNGLLEAARSGGA